MSIESVLRVKGNKVETIQEEDQVKAAATRMRNTGIAALVVIARDDVVGIITEREIVSAFAQRGSALSDMTVKEVMRSNLITVAPEDNITTAMALMTQHRTRHLPVMSDGQMVGIVSIGDVVKHRLDDLETETRVLRDIYIASH